MLKKREYLSTSQPAQAAYIGLAMTRRDAYVAKPYTSEKLKSMIYK